MFSLITDLDFGLIFVVMSVVLTVTVVTGVIGYLIEKDSAKHDSSRGL